MPTARTETIASVVENKMAAEALRELDRVVGEGTEWCEPRYPEEEDDIGESSVAEDVDEGAGLKAGARSGPSGLRARVAEAVKLAAWAETDVPVALEGAAPGIAGMTVMIHPGAADRRPWRVARMLVDPDAEGRVVVRICNASREAVWVLRGTTIGTWESLGAGVEVVSLEPEDESGDGQRAGGAGVTVSGMEPDGVAGGAEDGRASQDEGRDAPGVTVCPCEGDQSCAVCDDLVEGEDFVRGPVAVVRVTNEIQAAEERYKTCGRVDSIEEQQKADDEFLETIIQSCQCKPGQPCHAKDAWERVTFLRDWHRKVQWTTFQATVRRLRAARKTDGDDAPETKSDERCECEAHETCLVCGPVEEAGGVEAAMSVAAKRWRSDQAKLRRKGRMVGMRIATLETDGATRGSSAAKGDDAIYAEDKWVPTAGPAEPGPHTVEELREYLAKDSPHLTEAQREEVLKILAKYPEVITNRMGQTPLVEHHIETGDARPIYGARFRKSPAEVEEIQRQVDQLLEKGVVRESDSPWAAPVVLARKSDGTWRFCVDYRRLNAVTQRDSYPLPRIDATLDRLGGGQYFTTMDLLSGFWQVPVREADRNKTAFCTTSGLYEWNCMPMGLINSPATFQRLMDRVLGKLRYTFALVYLDDIMVHSSSWEEHLVQLDAVFQCLKKAGLTVKLKKCHFGRTEVEYLGHVVGREGIKVDPKKVAAIADLRAPRNVSEVRTLLGMIAYYRRFIPDCSALSKPLHNLTRKDAPFVWDEACQASMAELKRLLVQAPALRPPDFSKPFRVRSDASYHGLGATLLQGDPDNGEDWYVVAYASRSLTKAEKNYSATDLECRGVLFAISQFRPYIYGRKFQMETDHKALIWLLGTKHSNGRLQRSVMELQTYDYEIVHKAGITMQDADCLSRLTAIKAVCAQHADRPAGGTARIATLEGVLELNAAATSTDRLASPQARRMTRREIVDRVKTSLYEEERWFEVRAMLQWQKGGALPRRRPKVSPWARQHALSFALSTEGLLFHVSATDALGEAQKRMVVPTDMRREVMYACHEHMVSGGHLGRDRTVQKIQQRYYWPGMTADVERWVASCVPCLAAKTPSRHYRLPISAVPVPARPWDLVSVDATGPFPSTERGSVYVVVFTDHLTRWVEAFAVPDIETSTIADLLVKHIICRHGAPRMLLSDQGSSFISQLAAAVYHRCGVKKIQASTYHPQTNGLVERFNRTMKEMLQKYVDTRHTDWDLYVPFVVFAYNTSAHKALDGLTPFQMLYGRKPTLPVDAMLLPAETQRVLTEGEQSYYADLQHGLQLLHSHGRHSLQRQQRERIWRRSARGNVPSFKVGDVVWIKEGAAELTPDGEPGVARKLLPRWKGPFIVTRVVGALNYVVQGPGGYEKLVHVERVKIHRQDGGQPPPGEDSSDDDDAGDSGPEEEKEEVVLREHKGSSDEDDDDRDDDLLLDPGAPGEDKAADSSDDEGAKADHGDDEAVGTEKVLGAHAPVVSEAKQDTPDGLVGDQSGRAVRTAPRRTRRPPDRLIAGGQQPSQDVRRDLGPLDRRQMRTDRAQTAVRRRNQCRVCGQLRAGHKCPGHYVSQPQSAARYARHAAKPKPGPDAARIVFGIRRRDGSASIVFKGPGRVTKAVDGHHLDEPRDGGDQNWHDTCAMCDSGGAVVCCYSCNEVVHPGCLQRQDMAKFADDEDYLCAQCAHDAWTNVLAARAQEPGHGVSPFSTDRPLPVVTVSALAGQTDAAAETSSSDAEDNSAEEQLIGGGGAGGTPSGGVGSTPAEIQLLAASGLALFVYNWLRMGGHL
jgi:transposase InsO family protein